jgi:N-acetylglucosaminyldiphosphoundecaprenol N-acetyl-beta-D-mannosaminyltransferase
MPEKVEILGVRIDRMNLSQTIRETMRIIEEKEKRFFVVPNVFIVTQCKRDTEYRRIINSADIAFADGVPLVWASRLLGEYTGGRVSGADFFKSFNMVAAEKGYSCYYLGGGPGGSEKVAKNFAKRHRALRIVGNFSPPFGEISDSLNAEILERINAVKPDILWVGLGAPRQEKWIYNNLEQLDVHVAIGVGAAFDYEAGKRKRAPRWMHKIGMEWFYRILFENPTLFWTKRYYAYLWEFIIPVLFQVMKKRIYLLKKGN